MSREQLVARIAELMKAIENSAANHNALAGRLAEAQNMLKIMDEVIENLQKGVNIAEKVAEVL